MKYADYLVTIDESFDPNKYFRHYLSYSEITRETFEYEDESDYYDHYMFTVTGCTRSLYYRAEKDILDQNELDNIKPYCQCAFHRYKKKYVDSWLEFIYQFIFDIGIPDQHESGCLLTTGQPSGHSHSRSHSNEYDQRVVRETKMYIKMLHQDDMIEV